MALDKSLAEKGKIRTIAKKYNIFYTSKKTKKIIYYENALVELLSLKTHILINIGQL